MADRPSVHVVAAICGNWWRESTLNPGLWESMTVGTGGFGLGQWTGTRRTDLFTWLDANGYNRDDGTGQCAFFLHENDWQAATSTPLYYATLNDFLHSTSGNIEALTETFMNAWERPGVPALAERIQGAKACFEHIIYHPDKSATWISNNSYLGTDDRLNNALCVWNYLGSGILPPTPGLKGWKFGAARELYRRRYIHR